MQFVQLTISEKISEWFNFHTRQLIVSGIIFFIALICILFIHFFSFRFRKKVSKKAESLANFLRGIIETAVIIITIFILLAVWRFNVVIALITMGILLFVLGLGAKNVLGDVIAGITIVFGNYYDVDEIISIQGFKGKVIDIGIRSTKIMNWQGEVRIFMNGSILEVSNYSRNFSVASVLVEIARKEDINHVITLLDEELPSMKELFPQIIEGPNVVGIEEMNSEKIILRINAKTNPEEHYVVERGLKKYIKELFENHHIKLPHENVILQSKEEDQHE